MWSGWPGSNRHILLGRQVKALVQSASSCQKCWQRRYLLSARIRRMPVMFLRKGTIRARSGHLQWMGTRRRRTKESGSVRKLPSGKWQARVHHADGTRIPLVTFATKRDAAQALTRAASDQLRGRWIDPRGGRRGVCGVECELANVALGSLQQGCNLLGCGELIGRAGGCNVCG
jgi:hypothetical protein